MYSSQISIYTNTEETARIWIHNLVRRQASQVQYVRSVSKSQNQMRTIKTRNLLVSISSCEVFISQGYYASIITTYDTNKQLLRPTLNKTTA